MMHESVLDAHGRLIPDFVEKSSSEHQRELAALRRLRLRQRRKRDFEQGHSFSRWQEWFEEAEAQTFKVRETVDGVVDGLASCDLLKVGELHLQGDSPPSDAGRQTMPPDLGDDGIQRVAHRLEFVQVLANVFSASTDLRTRSARTGRSSTPR